MSGDVLSPRSDATLAKEAGLGTSCFMQVLIYLPERFVNSLLFRQSSHPSRPGRLGLLSWGLQKALQFRKTIQRIKPLDSRATRHFSQAEHKVRRDLNRRRVRHVREARRLHQMSEPSVSSNLSGPNSSSPFSLVPDLPVHDYSQAPKASSTVENNMEKPVSSARFRRKARKSAFPFAQYLLREQQELQTLEERNLLLSKYSTEVVPKDMFDSPIRLQRPCLPSSSQDILSLIFYSSNGCCSPYRSLLLSTLEILLEISLGWSASNKSGLPNDVSTTNASLPNNYKNISNAFVQSITTSLPVVHTFNEVDEQPKPQDDTVFWLSCRLLCAFMPYLSTMELIHLLRGSTNALPDSRSSENSDEVVAGSPLYILFARLSGLSGLSDPSVELGINGFLNYPTDMNNPSDRQTADYEAVTYGLNCLFAGLMSHFGTDDHQFADELARHSVKNDLPMGFANEVAYENRDEAEIASPTKCPFSSPVPSVSSKYDKAACT
ncbi:unnamed protein product [Protopolystoma xenopodis]|uniref:Uncharacterized protein n=1 Tax=Protopolystoma xenopodis TaxID=117903 RepID=A0A448WF17_9PLAT|nr:unnamed protein product [Protopolystoma xenopodis]